ncbi:DUF4386 domain-containing protein [Candidatus Margulisiibacteriota bacterium]
MNSNRKTAIITGVLFITATVAFSIGMIILEPILGGLDYLTNASANANLVIIGALLVLIDSVAVAGIAIVLYRILKKHNDVLALGYVGARIIEGIFFMVYAITILTLLTLSKEFVQAGAPIASSYQALGTMLLAAGNWAFLLGYGLVFGLSALILNFVLYRSRLVPRWLSGWGFVSAAFVFINFFLQSFGISFFEFLDFSIALQEMVFAVWLITKGFNPAAISSTSA